MMNGNSSRTLWNGFCKIPLYQIAAETRGNCKVTNLVIRYLCKRNDFQSARFRVRIDKQFAIVLCDRNQV
jgi:hypothetical protein